MTLQLEVGKTYRARNGDVVRIVGRDVLRSECTKNHPFLGDDEISYAENGEWDVSEPGHKWGLIEEVSTVKARATCDSWVDHTKPMLAKMEGEK
jgi:hypothetical protein